MCFVGIIWLGLLWMLLPRSLALYPQVAYGVILYLKCFWFLKQTVCSWKLPQMPFLCQLGSSQVEFKTLVRELHRNGIEAIGAVFVCGKLFWFIRGVTCLSAGFWLVILLFSVARVCLFFFVFQEIKGRWSFAFSIAFRAPDVWNGCSPNQLRFRPARGGLGCGLQSHWRGCMGRQ